MALNLRRRQTILCIVRSSVIMTNKFALSCAHSALNLTNTEFAFICARETTRSCSGTWTCQVHPQLIYDDYGIICGYARCSSFVSSIWRVSTLSRPLRARNELMEPASFNLFGSLGQCIAHENARNEKRGHFGADHSNFIHKKDDLNNFSQKERAYGEALSLNRWCE